MVDALSKVIGAAEVQLGMLEDAARRSGVDVARLTQQSFELLVAALASAAESADAKKHAAFIARVARWRAATVDVRHHLIELSEGWRCPSCKSDVAAGAAIDGVRAGLVRVELVCRACGKKSKLAAPGQAAFDRLFGPLVSPEWRPSNHGFTWSER